MRLLNAAVTPDIGTHRAAGDNATDRGDIPAGSAADLVAEDAADDGTDDRSGDVEVAAIILSGHLSALDPATLLAGLRDHRGTEVSFAW